MRLGVQFPWEGVMQIRKGLVINPRQKCLLTAD